MKIFIKRVLRIITSVTALGYTVGLGADADPARLFTNVALPAERSSAAPMYSDVCFSSRWRREGSRDTFRVARAFHATRLEWVYSNDPQWVRYCREQGFTFAGALNTLLPDEPGGHTYEKGRIVDQKGNPLDAPWLPRRWLGCANSPHYQQIFLIHARHLLEGGADTLHVDGAFLVYGRIGRGACFCSHCAALMAQQGVDSGDAKARWEFQRESWTRFYARVRKVLEDDSGRPVPLSINNYRGEWKPWELIFDYGVAELPESDADPGNIYLRVTEGAKAGKAQVFTIVGTDVPRTRAAIATAYASGSHVIAPWDVYLPDSPTRHFGNPAEYADLYGFVRGIGNLLDGYEDGAVAGPDLQEARYGSTAPIQISENSNAYAFVRARPGDRKAALVVHIVNPSAEPGPVTVRLRQSSLPFSPPYRVTLITPKPYEAADHIAAADSGDYAGLVATTDIRHDTMDGWLVVEVPAATPWVVLRIGGQAGQPAEPIDAQADR